MEEWMLGSVTRECDVQLCNLCRHPSCRRALVPLRPPVSLSLRRFTPALLYPCTAVPRCPCALMPLYP